MRIGRRRTARSASGLVRRTLWSRPGTDGQQHDSVRRDRDPECLGQHADILVLPDIMSVHASPESQLAERYCGLCLSRTVCAIEKTDGPRATGDALLPHLQSPLHPHTLPLPAASVLIDSPGVRTL